MSAFQQLQLENVDLHAEVRALRKERLHLRSYIRECWDNDVEDFSGDDDESQYEDADPPIFWLSEELITMVLDYVVDGDWQPHKLEHLRSIHPRFAYLSKLRSSMFREISLVPSRKDWDNSLFWIAPYVRKVNMHAASVWSSLEHREQSDYPINNKVVYDWLTSLWRRDRDSGLICETMVDALRNLPKAESFQISNASDQRGQIMFPKGDEMIVLGFEVLARASKQPKELTLFFHDRQDLDTAWFTPHSGVEDLKLDQLRILRFDGPLQERENPNLQMLLAKCSSSLQELYFHYHQIVLGVQSLSTNMSALRRLILYDITINLPGFCKWLAMCPVLQELSITHYECASHGDEVDETQLPTLNTYRPLFDAIRKHPSRMRVRFDPLSVRKWVTTERYTEGVTDILFFVDHNTADPCHEKSFRPTGDAEKDQKCREVINYMSNAGDWTPEPDEQLPWA